MSAARPHRAVDALAGDASSRGHDRLSGRPRIFESGERCSRRTASRPGRRNPILDLYFRDTDRFSLLSAAAETEAAHRIQRLAVAEWGTVLSCPAALPVVLCWVHDQFPALRSSAWRRLRRFAAASPRRQGRRSRDDRVGLRTAATELAWQLHDLDPDHRRLSALVAFLDLSLQAGQRRGPLRRVRPETFRRYRASIDAARKATERERERFVAANLRLVVAVAKRFRGPALPLPDLIQEGNIGLVKAAKRYDVRRGYRFSTYAIWWIRQAIGRAVADTGRLVRIPVATARRRRRARDNSASFEARHGRKPTAAEIGAEFGPEAREGLPAWSETPGTVVSLDAGSGRPDDPRPSIENLADEDATDPSDEVLLRQWRATFRQFLRRLPEVEHFVIVRKFGLELHEEETLKSIGLRLGRSRERVRQLEAQALHRLLGWLESR